MKDYALRGANLPLRNGGLIQAALTLLVIDAADRPGLVDGVAPDNWLGPMVFRPAEAPNALSTHFPPLETHELAAALVLGTARSEQHVRGAFCIDRNARVLYVNLEPPYVIQFVNSTIEQCIDCLEAMDDGGREMPRSAADITSLRARLRAIDAHAFATDDAFWPTLLHAGE